MFDVAFSDDAVWAVDVSNRHRDRRDANAAARRLDRGGIGRAGGFHDDKVAKLFSVEGAPLYLMPIGTRAK